MVTGIHHLQTPIKFIHGPKMNFQRAQTIQLVIKSTCAQNIKEARTRAPVENTGKMHMCLMRDCVQKNPCTPQNGAFMILVGIPPTSGSNPKPI
jgi:hypothetical protein